MSEEEMKAINKAKRIVNICRTSNHLSEILVKLDIEELEILINLIDKQQKEIELLKYCDRSSNFYELKYK